MYEYTMEEHIKYEIGDDSSSTCICKKSSEPCKYNILSTNEIRYIDKNILFKAIYEFIHNNDCSKNILRFKDNTITCNSNYEIEIIRDPFLENYSSTNIVKDNADYLAVIISNWRLSVYETINDIDVILTELWISLLRISNTYTSLQHVSHCIYNIYLKC